MDYRGFVITTTEDSYLIDGNNQRMFQENNEIFKFPYPAENSLEAAKRHIDELIRVKEEPYSLTDEVDQLRLALKEQQTLTDDLILVMADIINQ